MRRITTTLLLAGALGLGMTSPGAVAAEQHPATSSARSVCGGQAADYAGHIYASDTKAYLFERGGKVAVENRGSTRALHGTYRADSSGPTVTAGGAATQGKAVSCYAGSTVPKAITFGDTTYRFVMTR
ncbi:hypothetical protein ACIO3O_04535 [Streptomyces sp. NPDC087440]|uniref:hypothetical protein n=1 Tax=Streptomyces sp. NPDC087440 TaxID=3365790 RepID=UPI0038213B25